MLATGDAGAVLDLRDVRRRTERGFQCSRPARPLPRREQCVGKRSRLCSGPESAILSRDGSSGPAGLRR